MIRTVGSGAGLTTASAWIKANQHTIRTKTTKHLKGKDAFQMITFLRVIWVRPHQLQQNVGVVSMTASGDGCLVKVILPTTIGHACG